jgi:aspartyl-tRNA(Asn)/glutamyl-tRNA(Gln) amidotransferase subunit C
MAMHYVKDEIMSNFTRETLENLEKLCKITLSEKEKDSLLQGIKNILSYMEQLNELDTTNVPPCSHILKDLQQNVFRKDEIGQTLTREEFLSDAPEKISGMVQVPLIIAN